MFRTGFPEPLMTAQKIYEWRQGQLVYSKAAQSEQDARDRFLDGPHVAFVGHVLHDPADKVTEAK